MTESLSYEAAVIGAGPGGYAAALTLARNNKKTLLVEKKEIGGTCLNAGCIPTKTMLAMAGKMSYPELLNYSNEVIAKIKKIMTAQLMTANVTMLLGTAYDIDQAGDCFTFFVRTEDKTEPVLITCHSLILAIGTVPALPDGIWEETKQVYTSDTIFQANELKEHILIVGGGVIGVEFATIFAKLNKKVTIIEMMPELLSGIDSDLSRNLMALFRQQGIQVLTQAVASEVFYEENLKKVIVGYHQKEEQHVLLIDQVLFAVGRKIELSTLFRSGGALRQKLTFSQGTLCVNEHFMTAANGLYAIGDMIKKGALAHISSAQGMIAASHLCHQQCHKSLLVVPSCVYSDPEIACCGINLKQALGEGFDAVGAKVPVTGNAKHVIEKGKRGMVKLVALKKGGRILGAQLMCMHASDMIGELVTAVNNKLTAAQLYASVRAHPTCYEVLDDALQALLELVEP